MTTAELTRDPHPALRRLRAAEPVSWLPALGGWLVTSYQLAGQVLRDAGVFTVDDPRFTTARVVGPSMLSQDGPPHRRHRDPFARGFRRGDVAAGLDSFTASAAARLVAGVRPAGQAELRRAVAGPLAVAVMAQVLGLGDIDQGDLLAWYDAIVAGVSALPAAGLPTGGGPAVSQPASPASDQVPAAAAAAFSQLRAGLVAAVSRPGASSLLSAAARTADLSVSEIVSNAAVMLFGGIETTEGMICNAVLYLLSETAGPSADPPGADQPGADQPGPRPLAEIQADRSLIAGLIDESLRLEPAAAVVDRYATADIRVGAADIRRGDLVVVSLAGANRDPAVFAEPDRFDLRRANARQHLGFALGPHFCIGAQLARAETSAVITALLDLLPGLVLDPWPPGSPRGLVFRKPPALHVRWDRPVPGVS